MLKFPDKIDSKFRFVLLSAARAEQLVRGAQPKAEERVEKPSRTAMREIRKGLVDWNYGPAPEVELEDSSTGSAES